MKRVFSSNSQLAHAWAQQTLPEGRASNFFFEGPTLYSYGRHFIVAEFATAADGSRVALFNNGRYSISTARHQSLAQRAVYGLDVPIFDVPNPDAGRNTAAYRHAPNLADYARRIEATTLAAARARNGAEWRINETRRLWIEARDYAAAFAQPFDIPEPTFTPEFMEAARKAAAADRAAKAKATREREAIRAADLADRIAKWRSGENVSWWSLGDVPTMLRLRGDVVQTSRGAECPVEHAKRAWPVLKRCHDRGEAWRPNGHKLPLGIFAADAIEPDGTLRAGCHVIPWAELESMARTLGLVEG